MKKNQHLISIRGSKGKGGGGSTFEADDNMFARQSAAFIDALAEGPIKGLVYGDASILIDEVRLRNVNQTTGLISANSNFKNFTVITKNGDATQVVDADFFAEYPSAAFTQDIASAELLENEPQFFTISSGTFEKRETDYIKITMSTTGMSAITKKGDNKGDINETEVFFTIDFQWVDNSGVHRSQQMFDTGFEGKVSGKYAHTFGFNIEDIKRDHTINDWAIKVTKQSDSPDSSDTREIQNAIFVDSIEAAIADKLEYPYTAYVGGVIDAEAFNSVPARGYEIDGKLLQIPTNHYPCDYNGRKLVMSSASGFSVGDVINQGVTASSITAAGTAEDGYTATATIPAHGVTIGETFKVTIAISASQDEDFYEGTFVATAKSSTTFTYTLNKPFNESTGAFQTLTSTTATGTKTVTLFSGGLVDKKVGNTLYLRNVAASTSAIAGVISNGSTTGTVTSATQVFIPANYRRNASTEKPVAAEQDWDGTFYQSWCNNPAWVYNDLVTNKVYGLGNYLSQTQVNKWELFQIGRYCDELVPAGVGAADLLSLHCTEDTNYIPSGAQGQHEPRFSANLVIAGKNEAFKVLNDVTSIFRGMTYWLNGEAYLVQDSEKDPVYQFTNANVIDGKFAYEGTANKTRTNSIIVNWNNPQDYYRTRAEIVELEETLQKDNEFIKPEETTAFGCTSRGQARRLGKWKLLTNNLNTNTVTFSTSLNAAFLRPGDIIQVIDQNKEGKSWGGRVSSSSSTTAINIDRKPTSFGNTSVESGYAVGDYRLTGSFVGYKAILAQDTATIGGSNFVRGAHLTSITTEEAAATLQDDSGNLVFVQWTPFTFTETQTLSAVSNSGKTLTVASAFNAAPTNESIWILSRAALATGKTKKEAKLFRVMAVAESERNTFEVTGLEYNATKFDAVDKNEALSEYRTIYLPDSFKDVPAVVNIDVEPKIRAAGTGGTINSLIVDWDPATNSDGSLYTSLRHYEVDFSKDGNKWLRVGTNTNTEIEIVDSEQSAILSGTYYFKIRTVNLNGIRSPVAESGAIVVDFNRAVGPAEGSVGTSNHFINFIGNISGDFELDSGKISFNPISFQHNDGQNEHNVSSQGQLDFTGLDHSSSTGGDEGYVFFDHSASVFKAIAFDETSGQFYPVGSSVFATATGTLTASTSTNPKKFTGLDSTNFDGELAVGNVFKYTKGSNTRYHRVKRFTSDSELFTFQPTRDTIVNSDNQAFSKPNFLADYQNDTIMGKITKTGANAYTLQKFGSSQGEAAYEVHATNENFTFNANTDGTVTNETAYGCDFAVRKGSQGYTFAASGTAQNTFGISLQARTGFDNDADIIISGTGNVTVGDTDMDSITDATATMRIFDRGRGDLLIADKVLSFTKAAQGSDGDDGDNAKVVVVTPSSNVMYLLTFAEGESGLSGSGGFALEFSPTQITIRGATANTTTNGVWSTSAGTLTSIDNSHAAPSCVVTSGNFVDGMTVTYTLHSNDGGASDSTTLELISDFDKTPTIIFSNEAHVYPAATNGAVSDITGSGTDIDVFYGVTKLDFDGIGTARGKYKVTLNSPTGLTKGSITSTGSSPTRSATVGNHTPATNTDNYSLEYTISGKTPQNNSFSFLRVQSLTKSKTGTGGSPGSNGQSVRVETIFKKNDSSLTSTTGGTFANPLAGNTDWSLTMPVLSSNGDQAYAATRTFTSDGASPQDSSWSTPVNILTRTNGTNGTNGTSITVSSIQANTPSSGRTTVTFSNGSSFIIDDGTNGNDGDGVDVVYRNDTSTPATPSASSGAPSGWSFTQSAPSGSQRTFVSFGVRTNNAGNYSWSVPSVITAKDGVDGDDGDPGTSGEGASTCYYLQTGYSQPTKPSTGTANPPSGWTAAPPTPATGKSIWYSNGTKPAGSNTWTWAEPIFYIDFDFGIAGIFDFNFNWDFNNLNTSIAGAGGALTTDLNWGSITISAGSGTTTWTYNAVAYNPTGTTQALTMAIAHPTLGTSSVVGTWTRGNSTATTAKITGFSLGTGSGATGSGNNTWTFGDVNSDAGSSDNAFGSASAAYVEKTLYVQHSASNTVKEISAVVINTNFNTKCLTPAMLPKNIQIGDFVESPTGLTEVLDVVHKTRDGYWILEDELEITSGHPILIDGEWILAEEYQGRKVYVNKETEVVYVETANELLTVKNWTVGGKY